ncbi:MAG: heavy metal translocating P-type ATPase [Desulfobulbaceae bacterium]
MPSALTCTHCNQPIPTGGRITGRIDGRELHFCCRGCQGAYLLITGAGLGSFYERRSSAEAGIPEGAFTTEYSDEYLQSFVSEQGDGLLELSFIVGGIRCAACVWLIETFLARTDGVVEARINYSTHRGRVVFDPRSISPAEIFHQLVRLGYVPRPFTRDAARAMQEEEGRGLLIRFGTAAFLSMQLMGYSIALYGGYFSGMEPPTRTLMQYFAALVATPVVFFSGAPFLKGALRSLRNRTPDMDLLIGLGVLAAYFYSLWALVWGGEVYFETPAMIVTLILLGRIFEHNARGRARGAIDRLLSLAPDTARLVRDGETRIVDAASLGVDDIILVAPGERLPVDGVILEGETDMDESVLTGEAKPVRRRGNDRVLSGSLNVATAVRVRVTRTAADSFMASINRMIEEAQHRKAPVQGTADRVAGLFVPAVLLIALATALYWWMRFADPASGLLSGVAVLVVACPCALGLATPTAILVATGVAAGRGILFRGGDTLEMTGRVTLAAFDKTGTLTEPFPKVVDIRPAGISETELLSLAARLEAGSSHPLARGIMAKAREEHIAAAAEGSTIIPGRGVRLMQEDEILLAGSRSFLAENDIPLPIMEESELTEVHVAENGVYRGCILLDNRLRPGAAEMVRSLAGLGLRTALLTGDHPRSAEQVARQAGITAWAASMAPEDKTEWVRSRLDEGELVLMAGDGVNDAPALSAASVGCAMGGSTDVALETSDLVLVKNELLRLPEAIQLARKTLAVIRQNLFWAFSYNLVALPLAATGRLAPVYAAAAMAASSVCVVANSLRIKRFRPRRGPGAPGTGDPHA